MVVIQKEKIQLYQQDCLLGMAKHLKDGEVSTAITSPPYNLGINYSQYQDNKENSDYLDWMERVGLEIHRVLDDQGSFFLNMGSSSQNPWIPWDVAQRLRQHFVLQNQIVWVKSVAVGKTDEEVTFGHFKPINSERFLNHCYEFIFQFTKKGDVPLDRLALGVSYQDKSNIGRWKSAKQDKRCRGNTWFIPYETINSRDKDRPHPATFPVKLADMCLRLCGLEKVKLALDPFSGLGSTALACQKQNIPFVGFDIDSNYIEMTKKRLKEEREKES